MSKNVVICGFARSPFTPAKKGSLAKIRPDDLAAEVVKGLIKKHSININDVEDLILGCALFSRTWVDVSGQGPKEIAANLR